MPSGGTLPPVAQGSANTPRGRWGILHLFQAYDVEEREDRILLLLSLAIGALTGLVVVAFIVLTERLGIRMYPVGSAAWRRVFIPVAGSLGIGYLLYRYFPDARGSGVPQTKAALFARGGVITLATVLGKFFCTAVTLASGIPLGREGPAVQVGSRVSECSQATELRQAGGRLPLLPTSIPCYRCRSPASWWTMTAARAKSTKWRMIRKKTKAKTRWKKITAANTKRGHKWKGTKKKAR